jgi:hypothetical protein
MMKTSLPVFASVLLCVSFFAGPLAAADITAINSGNWSDPTIWDGGVVPSTNDDIDVESPYVITVDSDAAIQYMFGSGTVTLAPGVTLNIFGDTGGAYGAQQLDGLNATATGCTVIYSGNVYWAKRTDYYNLVFSGTSTTTRDFYNGAIPGYSAVPMNIAGNFTINGTNVSVQQGADITVGGNLTLLGATNKWDCSSYRLVVSGNGVIGGLKDLMFDGDGALGTNYFGGSVTVSSNALAWNLSDVTQWAVGGSLTNFGLIAGKGFGCITFLGSGTITGNAIKIPTLTINGTYTIGTKITLTTNTPTLNGTLVFDLANTNSKIILQSYPTNLLTLYYSGGLTVINSGPAPANGSTYAFFNATNYAGAFTSTSYPSLPSGFSWVDNLLTSGSISVTGAVLGSPMLAYSLNGLQLTLSWDSATYPGYSVQAQTNSINSGLGSNWTGTGSGTISPYVTTINPAKPTVFYRLIK